eukprot:CAMPEP_0114472270 /NCGR_PEP_ID=MMETSP0104-20121206/12292_1 /TAXON_ID=37642 ORGANISM="Paraphysomonas imperforata, Strain PA2" /NCGR_SAMPLE_ID=MMETSP0104 /ASSEMBLY_ACC=CAM_ASM_000202 /LENGTH=440 /DNA_ID=CAMNT_0001646243 /DNA_START=15 /DNA_END=1337 /DNA_ORIENTATION=+
MINVAAQNVESEPIESSMTQCLECHKVLKKKSLARHMREIHPKIDNILNCPHCDKSFARKSNLTRHIESNHSEKVIEKSSNDLKSAANRDKRFHCSVCGLYFKQKCHYTEHIRIHQGFRFNCSHCQKSFSRATTLKQHMLATHPNVTATTTETISSNTLKKSDNGNIILREVATTESDDDGEPKCKQRCCSKSTEKLPSQHTVTNQDHDHRGCTKVAYLQHDDHVDFLHSCGSVFCHDERVPLGQAPHMFDNLHAISLQHPSEGTKVFGAHDDHSACASVGFLPHGKHVDFLHSCGSVSCRSHTTDSSMQGQGEAFDHSTCTKVAYLHHNDHVDFLHSCGRLFCHDEEISFGEAPHTHENLHAMVAPLTSSVPETSSNRPESLLGSSPTSSHMAKKARNTSSPPPPPNAGQQKAAPNSSSSDYVCPIDQDMVSNFCNFFE